MVAVWNGLMAGHKTAFPAAKQRNVADVNKKLQPLRTLIDPDFMTTSFFGDKLWYLVSGAL